MKNVKDESMHDFEAENRPYIGLRSIGQRMGWSAHKVFRMHYKHAFPLVRLPYRRQWAFQTTDVLIALWWNGMAERTRERTLQKAAGRRASLREGLSPNDKPSKADDARNGRE